jgi:hypothetical protein
LSSQRHSSGCWRTLSVASSPLHKHASATRDALTGIVAQAQAITKNINPQGRATTDVEQALPVSKYAAAPSVATLFKRFDNAVLLASWDFVTDQPVRGLRFSDDVRVEELEQTKRDFALPIVSYAAASSTAPIDQVSKCFDRARWPSTTSSWAPAGTQTRPPTLISRSTLRSMARVTTAASVSCSCPLGQKLPKALRSDHGTVRLLRWCNGQLQVREPGLQCRASGHTT